jgi:hypothetical protein
MPSVSFTNQPMTHIKETLPMIAEPHPEVMSQLAEMRQLLIQIQGMIANPTETRESYTVEEVASLLSKNAYTVREWCRHGRINASKRVERRGGAELWSISSAEVTRIKDDGLLRMDPNRNRA